jgi:outer membrane protein TolC
MRRWALAAMSVSGVVAASAVLAAASTALAAAQAGAAEDARATLTLEQALQLARKRNRSLAVERARLSQAQAAVGQAWAALFPTLAAQGKYTHNYKEVALNFGGDALLLQPSEQFDGSISFTTPLLAPAAYPALSAVKAGARAAEAQFSVSETDVLMAVAQTYYAASITDELLAARRSNIDVAQATLKNAQARLAAGTVTKVDLHRAELALLRAEQQEREARDGQERTYRALGTLIQKQEPFRVEQRPLQPEQHDERELDAALQRRPETHAIEASLRSAEAERRARAWQWAPMLSAFGLARKFNYDNFARDRYSWAVGAQLDWLLYDGGTRDAQRRVADAQAREAQARAEVWRDSVRDDLADSRSRLAIKQRNVETAERAVALARETLALVRIQYEAGSVTQVDLLQVQDALVASQEALAQAHYDAATANLMLRRAAGTFPGR